MTLKEQLSAFACTERLIVRHNGKVVFKNKLRNAPDCMAAKYLDYKVARVQFLNKHILVEVEE